MTTECEGKMFYIFLLYVLKQECWYYNKISGKKLPQEFPLTNFQDLLPTRRDTQQLKISTGHNCQLCEWVDPIILLQEVDGARLGSDQTVKTARTAQRNVDGRQKAVTAANFYQYENPLKQFPEIFSLKKTSEKHPKSGKIRPLLL